MKKIDEIDRKIAIGQQKLEEIKNKLEENSKKANQLAQNRASIQAEQIIEFDKKKEEEIKKVSGEIDALKKDMMSGEAENLIEALNLKIKNLSEEKNVEILKLNLREQTKYGDRAVSLSQKLVEELGICNQTNEALRKVFDEYEKLRKITKQGTIKPGSKTVPPSQEMLKYLAGIKKWQFEEQKPLPCIEVARMRI